MPSHADPAAGRGDLPTGAAGGRAEANQAGADGAGVAAADPVLADLVATCTRIIDKMVACVGDPGFEKYQARWTVKGAPKAGKGNFRKRILAWRSGGTKAECDRWARRERAAEHLGSRSKLSRSIEDTKLSCTLFGQELDDDGWVPTVLRE